MLIRSLGDSCSLRRLREQYDPGRDGMSVRHLYQLLKDNGYETKVLRVQGNGYKSVPTPYVVYWENIHYVTVENVSRGKVTILDPSSGRRRLTHDKFQKSFSGLLISAVSKKDQSNPQKDPSPWTVVTPFLKARPKLMVSLVCLAATTSLVTIYLPQILSGTITNLIQGGGESGTLLFLLGVLVGYVLIGLTNALVSIFAALSVGRDISVKTFSHMLNLPYKYFALRARGDLLYRLHTTQQLEQLLTGELARGVSALLVVVAAGATLLIKSPPLGGVALAIFFVLLIGLSYAKRNSGQWADMEAQHESMANSIQVDSISTITLVKTTGLEQVTVDSWKRSYDAALVWRRRRSFLDGGVQTLVGFIQSFSPLVLTILALAGTLGPRMEPGDALALQMLSAAFFAQITVMGQLATRVGEASAAVSRLEDILRTPSDQTFVSGKQKTVGQRITMSDVVYGYSNLNEPVVRDISISCESGAKVAIVGPSGSGKSTLAKLLVGLITPQSGVISFDGVPLSNHDRMSFRSQVTYVEQEPSLRNASIQDNIRWGRSGLTREDIVHAAKKSGIHDAISAMPMGYETLVTQNGANLSGGERQRVALARALAVDPKVIVLDESTSALDRNVERQVMESLRRSFATRIVIAHRLETIRDSDQIYVLDNGRVIASGIHENLLNECDLYAKMYKKELSAEPDFERI